jgi:hypothetical protein
VRAAGLRNKRPPKVTGVKPGFNQREEKGPSAINVGRSPEETLRILDGLQTDELCPCNRDVGGEVLKAA